MDLEVQVSKVKIKIKNEPTPSKLLFAFVIYTIIASLLALWTERNLEYVGRLINGANSLKVVDIPYWLAFLVQFVFSAVMLVFNIICEILRYFI